jgi:2-desacetyl-2-hydroxyethyl bacteriochlorophyllide A dehydrogenase
MCYDNNIRRHRMKVALIKDAKSIVTGEIEAPVNKKNEVLIDIIRTGICGSDLHYWYLGQPKGLVMGHEFCGTVVDPGDREDLKVGDRVTALPISPCGKCPACLSGNVQYCPETWSQATGLSLTNPGGLSKRVAVRCDMVIKVPDNVSSEEAAMTEPLAVGLHAVHLADIKVGDKVLVIGGGIIGLVSSMFAKIEGATYVAISETNPKRGEKAVSLNVADEWLDARDEKFQEKLREKSGFGFDVVIDCSGNSKAVNSAIVAVRPGGTVVLVGVSMLPIEFNSVTAVMKELTLKGAIAYKYDEFKVCLDLMSHKQIDAKKFLSKVVSLDETQAAYEELTSGESDAIKIMIDPNI